MIKESFIYNGDVIHKRFRPKEHFFKYKVFSLFIDLSELEKIEKKNVNLNNTENIIEKSNIKKNEKIYINLKALDKITAKTSAIKLAIGEKKFFGPLEIKALKCQLSESNDSTDVVAYLQVKDLSTKNNNQVFLFNGWTFASNPTLQSMDHPIYDLWIVGCENV